MVSNERRFDRLSPRDQQAILLLERRDCERLQEAMHAGDIAHWYAKTQHGIRGFRIQPRRGEPDVFVACGRIEQWLRLHVRP
jgi:hypothetical protein